MSVNYKYPLYPWEKEWSQYYIYQWHLVEYPPYYLGFRFGPASVKKTLEQIRKIDNVTRGIPKIILLCGWQQYVETKATWDTQFPSFVTTSNDFTDGSIGATANDAIRWLMTEAKKYNTQVSFHLDYGLVQEHSVLWQEYVEQDLLCRHENGVIKTYGEPVLWEGRVNLQREFDAGMFQRRMKEFFDAFPEVLETRLIHNDWNTVEDSPWHNYTRKDDFAALRRNMQWIKETYKIDVMCENLGMGNIENNYGVQCVALSFGFENDPYPIDQTKVPAYIMCGGHGGIQTGEYYTPGALVYPDNALLFGAANQGEFGYNYTNDENIPKYENNLFRDFCYTTLPWYYLNRLLRLSFDSNTNSSGLRAVTFSDNVKSFIDDNGKVCITKDGDYIRQGNDIFIPELWKTNKEIMAWSDDGYKNKSWKLPEDWAGIKSVDLYNNNLTGISFRETLPVDGTGFLTLSLSVKDGVIIVPRGANPDDSGEPLPPSGTAEYIGQDSQAPSSENLPENAKVKFIGGDAALHEIIDIDVGETAQNVSLYFYDRDNAKSQVVLDVIDANSIQRLGSNTTKLLNNYAGGIYVTYKITGHVRFRITRFHYDHFGRNDGQNEAGAAMCVLA